MIDRTVTVTMLKRLAQVAEIKGGVEENVLMMHVNIFCPVSVTTDLLREHLAYAKGKQWIDSRLDEIDQRRWWLTPAGEVALRNMEAGA